MNNAAITPEQELSLLLCDAWLRELDLLLDRIEAREPVHQPLGPLWGGEDAPGTDTPTPVEPWQPPDLH